MITHPTVLTIDAEAQQFAARHHPAAAPETETTAARRRGTALPRALIAGLRTFAQRAMHRPRPATTPR